MHIKYDKTLYFKIERFLACNSIYIWKVLLKSFPTVYRTMPKVLSVKSYKRDALFQKVIYMPISSDPQMLKTWENVFFDLLINCNRSIYIVYSDLKCA